MAKSGDKASLTRRQVLQLAVHAAEHNGFSLESWFRAHIDAAWTGWEAAIATLLAQERYYALLFSHEFARAMWKHGAQMSLLVPSASYSMVNRAGEVVTVHRKPFIRRTTKPDAWKYHLRQMAVSEDPLAYLRRFLPVVEHLRSE